MATEHFPVTVVVLTQDEEANIGPCLESLAWADDVVILDSGSNDATLARVRAARPDARISERPFRDFGDQRNWALDHTAPRHEWILFLDADERCTPACAEAIQAAVRSSATAVGYYLTCRNYFLGRWIRHCTLYPSWQLRLLKRGHVRYRKEGHGQQEVTDGPLGYVKEPYDHFGFSKGVAHWIERHNRYSSEEVELIERLRREPFRWGEALSRTPVRRRRALKRIAAHMGFRPLGRFLYLYVIRRGFLDGREGLLFCLLRVAQEIHIVVKLREAHARGVDPRSNE